MCIENYSTNFKNMLVDLTSIAVKHNTSLSWNRPDVMDVSRLKMITKHHKKNIPWLDLSTAQLNDEEILLVPRNAIWKKIHRQKSFISAMMLPKIMDHTCLARTLNSQIWTSVQTTSQKMIDSNFSTNWRRRTQLFTRWAQQGREASEQGPAHKVPTLHESYNEEYIDLVHLFVRIGHDCC